MDWGGQEGLLEVWGQRGPPPVWGRVSSVSGAVRDEGCEDPAEGLGQGRGLWGGGKNRAGLSHVVCCVVLVFCSPWGSRSC